MQAFILAGGFATRLWPLTEKRAKPLLPLAGKPIISHLIEGLPKGLPVTVSTNAALKEGFEEWQKTQAHPELSVLVEDTAHEDQKLGALGAVADWAERHSVQEDVLLLTGDNYCGFPLSRFLAAARPDTALLAAHDIGDLDAAKAFGTVVVDASGRQIQAFEEKPAKPKTTLVSTGCSLLPASTVPILVEYAKRHPDNVGGIFEELLRQGKSVDCFTFEEPWFDIGSFEAYLAATRALVGRRTLLEPSSSLEGTHCEGTVVIGKECRIRRSTLENVVVFDRCHIEDCELRDCIVDNGCTLRGIDLTGKMLRSGTSLTRN